VRHWVLAYHFGNLTFDTCDKFLWQIVTILMHHRTICHQNMPFFRHHSFVILLVRFCTGQSVLAYHFDHLTFDMCDNFLWQIVTILTHHRTICHQNMMVFFGTGLCAPIGGVLHSPLSVGVGQKLC
jgi:hypothetical protein